MSLEPTHHLTRSSQHSGNDLVQPAVLAVSEPKAADSPHPRPAPRFPGLGRIVLFFTMIAALAYGIDALVTHGLKQIRTSKFGSLNNVFAGRVNADIIINGSSRALTHYDPRIIEKATGLSAYNLGMNGIQTDVQVAVLKAYLRRNSKPKLVIQNLESFSFDPTKLGEIYDPAAYVPYLSVDELYRPLLAIDPAVWKWRHIPLYGYAVEDVRFTWVWGILGCLGFSGPEDYYRGFNPRFTPWTEDFERFRDTVGTQGVTNRINPRGVAALTEVARTCRENGIPLILVYSPVYYEMQALERNRTEVFSLFEKLSRDFDVPLWDYSGHSICLQRDNFYNSQHLNASGAALFSLDLAEKLARYFSERSKLDSGPTR